VAAVDLKLPIRKRPNVHIMGHTTDLVQPVECMQMYHYAVGEASPGDHVALKMTERIRAGSRVYLVMVMAEAA
jgi:hypothetical protein